MHGREASRLASQLAVSYDFISSPRASITALRLESRGCRASGAASERFIRDSCRVRSSVPARAMAGCSVGAGMLKSHGTKSGAVFGCEHAMGVRRLRTTLGIPVACLAIVRRVTHTPAWPMADVVARGGIGRLR
eukprot:5734552-Prymnesium_polylepis.1